MLGYDPEEQDHYGWTSLHLSVHWPLGMEILLAAGVQHNERLLESAPCTLLEYAVENRQDESILLLLGMDAMRDSGYDRFLPKIILHGYEPSSHVVTATIGIMMQRSNCLRSLAIANLSPCELDRLCISYNDEPINLLDAFAAPTVDALKKVGVEIPEALDPGRGRATVFHGPGRSLLSPELGDRLWSSGFRDTNVHDNHGFTPLHHACQILRFDTASWLMSHGGDPTTAVRGHSQNAFHLLSCGIKDLSKLQVKYGPITNHLDIVSRIAGLCGTSCQDDCRCACSLEGCTPTSVLLRATARSWCEKEDLFSSWCQFSGLSSDAIEICCLEFARMETFERLGITHVCCKIDNAAFSVVSGLMPQDTEEIQDEESEIIDELESRMKLYEEERAKFEGPAIQFLGKWSDMLKDELNVPAAFEEYWSQRVKTGGRKYMPDYFGVGELL